MRTTKLLTALFTESLMDIYKANKLCSIFTLNESSFGSSWMRSYGVPNTEIKHPGFEFQFDTTLVPIHRNADVNYVWLETLSLHYSCESKLNSSEYNMAFSNETYLNCKDYQADETNCDVSITQHDSVDKVVRNSIQPPVVYLNNCRHSSNFVLNANESVMNNNIYWLNYSDSIVEISDTLVKAISYSFTCLYVAEYVLVTNLTGRQSTFGVLFSIPHLLPILADTLNCGAASFTRFHYIDAHISDYRW